MIIEALILHLYNIKNLHIMIKVLLVGLLAAVVLCQTLLISSSTTSANILSPPGYTLVAESYHTTNNPNYLGNGAQWIWLNGTSSWPIGFTAKFQALFYVDCPQVGAILKIAADDQFTANLNGATVGTGTNWKEVCTFNVKLKCGWNELNVEVVNTYGYTPAALVFSIEQDQSNCYDCSRNPSAFYNRNTCQCECSTKCACLSKFQNWFDYPTCGCKCKYPVDCIPTRYWDNPSCSCLCKPIWCPKGLVQSSSTCLCVRIIPIDTATSLIAAPALISAQP